MNYFASLGIFMCQDTGRIGNKITANVRHLKLKVMWSIFQAPLHFLKMIVKQKPLCKVKEITFLGNWDLTKTRASTV